VLGFIHSHVILQQRCPSGGAAAGQVNIVAAIRHPNVVLFMGVCLDPPCMVTEWCAPRPHPLQRLGGGALRQGCSRSRWSVSAGASGRGACAMTAAGGERIAGQQRMQWGACVLSPLG